VTCRPEALDPGLPGAFRPLAVPRRVVVAKRKHGDTEDRWRWEGDLVGAAGPGWLVVRHVRGRDVRMGSDDEATLPDSAVTLRWLGARAPATILVKLDETAGILEVKVDAALPVPYEGGRFLFVDLDVDVVRDAAGTVAVRDWDLFEARAALLGYTDASRMVARAGEAFGLRLLAAWEPTLADDVAAILAATGTTAAAMGPRQVGEGTAGKEPEG
jgi:hypothetical protein